MPKSDSQEPATNDVEKLFQDIIPYIPVIVRKVCQNLGHHPCDMEFDGLVQRIALLLIDNDFYILRSFNNHSEPQTWLFTITRRYILCRLRIQKRELWLEDFPQGSFISQSDQEEKVLSEEREKLLLAAVAKLTEHERKLFYLITQELETEEIVKKLGIKKESVYREKSVLIKKLQNIIAAESAAPMAVRKKMEIFLD